MDAGVMLTVAEVAQRLAVGEQTVRDLIHLPDPRRRLPAVTLGTGRGTYRIHPAALERWLADQAVHVEPMRQPRPLRSRRVERVYEY